MVKATNLYQLWFYQWKCFWPWEDFRIGGLLFNSLSDSARPSSITDLNGILLEWFYVEKNNIWLRANTSNEGDHAGTFFWDPVYINCNRIVCLTVCAKEATMTSAVKTSKHSLRDRYPWRGLEETQGCSELIKFIGDHQNPEKLLD